MKKLILIAGIFILFTSSICARFNSIDPKASKYPSVSPYVYTLNNPMKFVDPNGKWIEPVHHGMFNQASATLVESGLLTSDNIDAMKSGSNWADTDINQEAGTSFMHAMADGSNDQPLPAQDPATATENHIQSKTMEFVKTGNFKALGVAIHAIQDSNSPSHEGYQKWTGNETNLQLIKHGAVEVVPTLGRFNNGVNKTRLHIQRAIMLRQAITQNESEEDELQE